MAITARKSRASRLSGEWRPRRAWPGVIIALCVLLTACGATAATGGSPSTATATATATAPAAPTSTTLQIATHVSPANIVGLCNGSLGANDPSVYAFSKTIFAKAAYDGLSYPSYTMPSSARSMPFKLGNSLDSAALERALGGAPNANPYISQPDGIDFFICDNGSQPITISGVGMGITSLTSHASPIDSWQRCDGAYQPGTGVTGGCGGGFSADEVMRATFPASAGQGATTNATMIEGYGPFPVIIEPGHVLHITVAVTMPTAPGVYTLALTLSATGVTGPATYAPLPPQLFTPVAHKWSGENCKAAAMLSQIPASDTSSYYICPA